VLALNKACPALTLSRTSQVVACSFSPYLRCCPICRAGTLPYHPTSRRGTTIFHPISHVATVICRPNSRTCTLPNCPTSRRGTVICRPNSCKGTLANRSNSRIGTLPHHCLDMCLDRDDCEDVVVNEALIIFPHTCYSCGEDNLARVLLTALRQSPNQSRNTISYFSAVLTLVGVCARGPDHEPPLDKAWMSGQNERYCQTRAAVSPQP
jgi:hypothetical protein